MPKKLREQKPVKNRLVITFHPACQTKRHREGYKCDNEHSARQILTRRTSASIISATYWDALGVAEEIKIPQQKTFVMGMGPKKYK